MLKKDQAVEFSIRTSKNHPFDKRLIKEIVRLVEEGVPRRDLLKAHGMSKYTLKEWMNRYGSPTYHASKIRQISMATKRSIVRAVESGMSVRHAQIAFGIKDRSSIYDWIRRFKTENIELSTNEPPLKAKKNTAPPEQKLLEQQLAEAQLKIRALETMIDIAEDQLKIDIRKKSGARQSPK